MMDAAQRSGDEPRRDVDRESCRAASSCQNRANLARRFAASAPSPRGTATCPSVSRRNISQYLVEAIAHVSSSVLTSCSGASTMHYCLVLVAPPTSPCPTWCAGIHRVATKPALLGCLDRQTLLRRRHAP